VGEKTAGAVASSELIPLPNGGGLQVAVATATTPDSNAQLDGVGVTPDVVSNEQRTIADYRSGRDPQIDATIAALANAPPPPTAAVSPPPLSPTDLEQLLLSVLPESTDLPTNDRLTSTDRWQRLDYIHPNELIDQNGGAEDPVGLQQALRARGYQGSVTATYGAAPGSLPAVSITADLYATADGAHDSATTNDVPQLQIPTNPSVRLGDDTSAYRGAWLAMGSTVLMWRHGRLVLTVTYSDAPGLDRPDTVSAIAQLVDSRAAQLNVP